MYNHQSPAIDFLQNIAKLLDCQAEAQILLKCRILENRQNSALCKPLHILKALETSLTQKNSLNFNRHQSCRNLFEKHTRSVSHPTCWCQCPSVFLQCLHFWNCVTSPGGCRNVLKVSVDPSCSVSISSINFTSVTERFDEKSKFSAMFPWKLTWHWKIPMFQ